MTGGGKGERKNLAVGALLFYKLKIEKKILLYDEKVKREKSNGWSCYYAGKFPSGSSSPVSTYH